MSAQPITDHYRHHAQRRLPGHDQSWLRELRHAAWLDFEQNGFPDRRHEDWKYTPVNNITRTRYGQPEPAAVDAAWVRSFKLPDLDAHTLVFVDGHYQAALSDTPPAGVTVVTPLAAALNPGPEQPTPAPIRTHLGRIATAPGSGFVALNTALMHDGLYLHVPRGVVVAQPIVLLCLSTGADAPAMTHLRHVIVLDDHAQATVIECYRGNDGTDTVTNAVTEIVLNANAALQHHAVQEAGDRATHIHWISASQARASRLGSHAVAFGGRLSRTDIQTRLNGEGAHVDMNGLYHLSGRAHCDFHTRIDHTVPHCTSNECYKGVLDGRSCGVFNGKVVVAPHAQKTDSRQKNDNLLLSRHAEINTKPELEIYADDVKCAHGATIGQIQPEALFYLRSRGLDEAGARALLVFAFADDILQRIPNPPVRALLTARLNALMHAAGIPQATPTPVHTNRMSD